jgi:hypothetical protein
MPDTFTYSGDQITQIQERLDAKDFPGAYRLAADFGRVGGSSSRASLQWMRGAANINQNVGTQAQFVRQFTADQYQARYGKALDLNLNNGVSENSGAWAFPMAKVK